MKKVVVLGMLLLLVGCAPVEENEEGDSSVVVTADEKMFQHIVMGKM